MEITNINLRLINKENSKLKAVASITFDDCFVVHDVKIIKGDTKDFVVMPGYKNATGKFKDIAHPIKTEFRNKIVDAMFDEYNKELNNAQNEIKE